MRLMPTHEQLDYLSSVGVEKCRLAPEGQAAYVRPAKSPGATPGRAPAAPPSAPIAKSYRVGIPPSRSPSRRPQPAAPNWLWYAAGPAAFLAGYLLFQLLG